ncbi:MAG: DUF1918 domain-containing protein [Acidimicrobiales bacterium]|jgi:hypothetical protein
MPVVGDRVQVPSKKVGQAPRDGVVTGVSGALVRVTWSSGEESTIMPSMGSLVVVGKAKGRAQKAASAKKAPTKKAAKAPAKKTLTKKAAKAPAKKARKESGKRKQPRAPKSSTKGSARAGKRTR